MGWTLVDSDGRFVWNYVRPELENDPGGLWWTAYREHGIQTNPLGSTKFRIQNRARAHAIVACATNDSLFDSLADSLLAPAEVVAPLQLNSRRCAI